MGLGRICACGVGNGGVVEEEVVHEGCGVGGEHYGGAFARRGLHQDDDWN